jgi:phage terminase large subunit-like protein
MSWAAANARVELKGNGSIITKQASGSAKINPLMAGFDAVALMLTNPWPKADMTSHLELKSTTL